MAQLPTKTVTFIKSTVSCSIVEQDAEFLGRKGLLKPIRVTRDGNVAVPFEERLYPLFLDSKSDFCILLTGASYGLKEARIPDIPLSAEIQFAVTPLELKLDDNFSWKVERDEFGVFVYLSASDLLVEQLVTHLVEKNGLRILSWGESFRPEHEWSIQLSAGLSIDTVQKAIASVADGMEEFTQIGGDQEFRGKLEVAQRDLNMAKCRFNEELETKNVELKTVYDELSGAIETVDRLNVLLDIERHATTRLPESANKLRRGVAEKALAKMIFSCFPNLAFPPDTIKLVTERFVDSESIWALLVELNSGNEVAMERLKGVAGKSGWLEVRRHINTGDDSRGRLYCRRSSKKQTFDVVMHWKKDKKDQERVFARLASYPPFPGREGILR